MWNFFPRRIRLYRTQARGRTHNRRGRAPCELFQLVIARLTIRTVPEQRPAGSGAAESRQSVEGRSVKIGLETQDNVRGQFIVEAQLAPRQDSACRPAVGKGERIGNSRYRKNPSAAEIDVARAAADIAAQIEARPTEHRTWLQLFFSTKPSLSRPQRRTELRRSSSRAHPPRLYRTPSRRLPASRQSFDKLFSISFVSLFEVDGENPAEVSPEIRPNCRTFQLLLVELTEWIIPEDSAGRNSWQPRGAE